MNKKILLCFFAVSLFFSFVPVNVVAQEEESISGLGFLIMGSVTENSTVSTGLTAFNIVNDGTVAIDITVSGTDMTGGVTWVLSDNATPGADIYGMKVGSGSYNVVVKKTAAYNTLISNLAVGDNQSFGVQFLAPTSFSDGVVKTGTLSLIITAH